MTVEHAEELVCPFLGHANKVDMIYYNCITTRCMAWKVTKTSESVFYESCERADTERIKELYNTDGIVVSGSTSSCIDFDKVIQLLPYECEGYCMRLYGPGEQDE